MPKKTKESISLPTEKMVHGVAIRKLPIGKFLEALEELKNLPKDFIKEISGGVEYKLSDIFSLENLVSLVSQLIIIAPKFIFAFLSKLMDTDEKYLRDTLTPNQLLDVCISFWEVNDLENFFIRMKPIIMKMTKNIGFNELLQSASK